MCVVHPQFSPAGCLRSRGVEVGVGGNLGTVAHRLFGSSERSLGSGLGERSLGSGLGERCRREVEHCLVC